MTDIAAQRFTIGASAVVTSADFTELDGSELVGPSSANWAFYTVAGGLPGVLIVSGTVGITGGSNAGVAVIPNNGTYFIDTYSFNIRSVLLGSGSYFFALTTTSNTLGFLTEGETNSGAAEFLNGGPWTAGYGTGIIGGVAVELDSAPEPGTLGLFGVGFGLLGLTLRESTRHKSGTRSQA